MASFTSYNPKVTPPCDVCSQKLVCAEHCSIFLRYVHGKPLPDWWIQQKQEINK